MIRTNEWLPWISLKNKKEAPPCLPQGGVKNNKAAVIDFAAAFVFGELMNLIFRYLWVLKIIE